MIFLQKTLDKQAKKCFNKYKDDEEDSSRQGSAKRENAVGWKHFCVNVGEYHFGVACRNSSRHRRALCVNRKESDGYFP